MLNGILPNDNLKDSLDKAYKVGQQAMEHFIDSRLVNLSKSFYDQNKKLKLGTFSDMTKKSNCQTCRKRCSFFSTKCYIWENSPNFTIKSITFERNL